MQDTSSEVAGTPHRPGSSRIIIKNLPNKRFTEADLKNHIVQFSKITDCRFFPERRIAFVGFETNSDADRAVKHFNRSYLRTSKLEVEIAKPVKEQEALKARCHKANSRIVVNSHLLDEALPTESSVSRKRKRDLHDTEKKPAKPGAVELQEFLNVMQSSSSKAPTWADPAVPDEVVQSTIILEEEDGSDDEYSALPKLPPKMQTFLSGTHTKAQNYRSAEPSRIDMKDENLASEHNDSKAVDVAAVQPSEPVSGPVSDADWLRSRTSRTLDLLPENDIHETVPSEMDIDIEENITNDYKEDAQENHTDQSSIKLLPQQRTPVLEEDIEASSNHNFEVESIRKTGRLFLRNLYYSISEDDVKELFSPFGSVSEVYLPTDYKTSKGKGFAYVLFKDPEDAVKAYDNLDQSIFQGRTLHILPAESKREQKLDDYALSKLPLKKQREIQKRRAAANSGFEWNSLFMSIDAVMSSMADRLGVEKAVLLDPTSSDAIVRQAHAETHVIQETKSYFENHGVDLASFGQKERGNKAILIKNFPFGTKTEELKLLMAQYGEAKSILMPPAGIIAIAIFEDEATGRAVFSGLYGRKFKDSVLKIEKGPKDIFAKKKQLESVRKGPIVGTSSAKDAKSSAQDLKQTITEPFVANTASLFVKNLNFGSTTESLKELFRDLDGFVLARIKTKPDPKKPGSLLSMGYGFVEFRSKEQANTAIQIMNGKELDGHKLEIKGSHKGDDIAAERRKDEALKRENSKGTKVVIKNLAFEVTEKQLRQLLGQYGKLRSVRLPKKFNRSTRGFGFAEFVSVREAENAINSLKHTHLHGRPLILQWANEDAKDSEEEITRLQEKVGRQVQSVRNAQLTGAAGRKKFDLSAANGEDDVE